jgi:hypothetical protein
LRNFVFILLCFISLISFAQSTEEVSNNYKQKFDKAKKSWAIGAKLRSDGFGFNFDYTRGKRYRSAMLYQLEFGYYAHLSQIKQFSSDYNTGEAQFKRYAFGKINNLFALHINIGQKILLAERARKNGVRIYTHYAAGFSLGILKPYMLQVVDTSSIGIIGYDSNGNPQYGFSNIINIAYENGKNIDYFMNLIPYGSQGRYLRPIVGGAGFGKGWNVTFQPGIHVKGGFSFDWSKDEGAVKGLDLGFACDIYFKKTPVMVTNNKSIFPSVYLGFQIGKKK